MSPRRKEVLRLGKRGQLVRMVLGTNHGDRCYLVLYRAADGRRKTRIFALAERTDAEGFAHGIALEQTQQLKPKVREPLTLEQLYAKYRVDAFTALRPRSRILYDQFWKHFVNFAGPHLPAEDIGVDTLNGLRVHLEAQGKAVNTIRRIMAIVRMVFRWGQLHEFIERNRVALYVYRVSKENRPVSPDEFRQDELLKILGTLDSTKATEWRPWVALTLCGYQGARQNSVLHLRWEDVDLEADQITWQSQWDKTGTTRTQPIRKASRAALEVAKARTGGTGWVLPGFGRGQASAPYTIQALWAALKRAEERAGIPHKSRRGGHGFRRLLAGEVNALTGDAKLAMDAIGDRDIRMAERYIKVRSDRVREALEALDEQEAK